MDILGNIFSDSTEVGVGLFMLCIGAAIVLGAGYFFAYPFKSHVGLSMRITLGILPAVVAVVIIMVNGNLGVGVAVAGAFSLVRFRSAQGTAKDILFIFMAMCSGLIVGVGYLFYALLFTIVMCGLIMLTNVYVLKKECKNRDKLLRITVPEDLEYSDAFTDVFDEYATKYQLVGVKLADMGTTYKLTYRITLKEERTEKQFIDKLRVRNGNLEINLNKEEENAMVL